MREGLVDMLHVMDKASFFTMKEMERSLVHVIGSFLISAVVLCFATFSFSASQDDVKIAAARKEGRLSFYTAMGVTDAVVLGKAFEEKYPGIKVDIFRGSSQGVVNRVMNEYRAKRHAFDVVNVSIQIMNTFKEQGILGRYISPESLVYPEGVKDADGFWTGIYYNIGVIAYNTKLVSPKEAPKTYEDLMNPKWRGKIMMNRLVVHWFALMVQQIGREKAESICRRLAANGLIYRDGGTLVQQLVSAGEMPIGFPLYGYQIEEMKAKGAQVAWNRPDPVFTSLSGMGVSSSSSHPNAGKLFVDFILSQQGQNFFSQFGKDPPRPGATHPIPKLVEGLTFPKVRLLSSKEYEDISKIYWDIFKFVK